MTEKWDGGPCNFSVSNFFVTSVVRFGLRTMFLAVTVIAAFCADRAFQFALFTQSNVDGLKLLVAIRFAVVASLPLLMFSRYVQIFLGIGKPSTNGAQREVLILLGAIVAIIGFVAPILLTAAIVPLTPVVEGQ
jgi:hypothetical protein